MDEFVRNRITQLRMYRGISEYQLSYDLGHSRGYINNISSGKALPSLNELFAICDYFSITPADFFDTELSNPELLTRVIELLKQLPEEDLKILLALLERIKPSL